GGKAARQAHCRDGRPKGRFAKARAEKARSLIGPAVLPRFAAPRGLTLPAMLAHGAPWRFAIDRLARHSQAANRGRRSDEPYGGGHAGRSRHYRRAGEG